jgi:NADH-quinone oxidoreductase subunit N
MDILLIKSFLPEIFLSISILVVLVFNAIIITDTRYNFPLLNREIFSQVTFILLLLVLLVDNSQVEGIFFNSLFCNDYSTKSLKFILISILLAALPSLHRSFTFQELSFYEFFIIILIILFSSMLLISSCDFLSAYIVIEIQALSFYILAGFKRDSSFSAEAGLKYFIFGSFISGILLFGCSLLYLALGTLHFQSIGLLMYMPITGVFSNLNYLIFIGVFLIVCTFLFKLSVFPFHFWAPDVYEGSPLSTAIVLSLLPKISLVCFFIKFLLLFNTDCEFIKIILLSSGTCSIAWGTFFAIQQKRLKKLFVYSSIAQVGFIVIALSLGSLNGFISTYFFLLIYLITSLAQWSLISILYFFQSNIYSFSAIPLKALFFSNLSGWFIKAPVWTLILIILVFSIAGIPPFSGFWSKFFILNGLTDEKLIVLPFVIVFISSISVFYYVRIVKISVFEKFFYFKGREQSIFLSSFSFTENIITLTLLYILIYTFFYPSFLLLWCQKIVLSSHFF